MTRALPYQPSPDAGAWDVVNKTDADSVFGAGIDAGTVLFAGLVAWALFEALGGRKK